MAQKNNLNKLIDKHHDLVHSEQVKVRSHVQREKDEWVLNTIMIDNIDVPFKYKRKKLYRSLKGQRVNMTYYPSSETVAGFEIEVMNVVRIKVS
jgi:dTDP-4-amino-4,6-dideoxygalactose transaminase